MLVFHEVHHFCLRTTCAMNHSVDFAAHFLKEPAYYGGICTGRGEHKFPGCKVGSVNSVEQILGAAVDEVGRDFAVECFGIFFCHVLVENVMACRG